MELTYLQIEEHPTSCSSKKVFLMIEEHPTSCSSKRCSSPIFIWLGKFEDPTINKFEYDLQTLKHYFIQLEIYLYTSAK